MEGLVVSVGVDGELAGEVAVDEDVAVGAGADDEGVGVVVGGADADLVAAAGADGAVVDAAGVDVGGGAEGLVGGSRLGGLGPDLGGEPAADAAVGSLVVVDEPEDVVKAIFSFYEHRAISPSAEEQEILLHL